MKLFKRKRKPEIMYKITVRNIYTSKTEIIIMNDHNLTGLAIAGCYDVLKDEIIPYDKNVVEWGEI